MDFQLISCGFIWANVCISYERLNESTCRYIRGSFCLNNPPGDYGQSLPSRAWHNHWLVLEWSLCVSHSQKTLCKAVKQSHVYRCDFVPSACRQVTDCCHIHTNYVQLCCWCKLLVLCHFFLCCCPLLQILYWQGREKKDFIKITYTKSIYHLTNRCFLEFVHCTDASAVIHQHVLINLLVRSVSHGKLQGPCTPWKLLPGSRTLVDWKAFALARYPQEQESGLRSSGQ